MKPIMEIEAQYIWSQKSKRYKKRYMESLTALYQDNTNKADAKAENLIVDERFTEVINMRIAKIIV